MSAFLFAANRMNMSYGDEINLTKSEKRLHTCKVLLEWPSAMEQLRLSQLYNFEQGIHLGDKLWKNQQYSALSVYKKLIQNPEQFWNGTDHLMNFRMKYLPIYHYSSPIAWR